jgi:peptidoglycan DL-endopeptidase CwlO
VNDRTAIAFFVTLIAAAAAWWYVRTRPSAGGGGGDFFSAVKGATSEQTTQAPAPAQQPGPVSAAPQPSLIERMSSWVTPVKGRLYDSVFSAAELAYGLPGGMLSRVAYQESRYNPDARSPVGATGLMQFMPQTARDFGVDPLDPFQSIWAAGKYLRRLYDQFGDWKHALAAYNWGPGNVAAKGIEQAPAETHTYYTQILGDLGIPA